MKICILGSTGFVGSHIVESIEKEGWDTIRPSREDLQSKTGAVFNGCDWVVNCIGETKLRSGSGVTVNAEYPSIYYRAAENAGCKGFVHVSSAAAITSISRPGVPVLDNDAPRPSSRYGHSKKIGDDRLLETKESLGKSAPLLCILRPPILIGGNAKGLFGKLRQLATFGVPLPWRGVGNLRSFMHVDNFAAAVIAAIKADLEGVYLTTDSDPIEPADLYHMMLAERGYGRRTFSISPLGRTLLKKVLGRRGHSVFADAIYSGVRFQQDTGLQYPLAFDEAIAKSMA